MKPVTLNGKPVVDVDVEIHADDFYVYKNGSRLCKYFSYPTCAGVKRYWKGQEKRLDDIERIYQKLVTNTTTAWKLAEERARSLGLTNESTIAVKSRQHIEERTGDTIYYIASLTDGKFSYFNDFDKLGERRGDLTVVESDSFHVHEVYRDSLSRRLGKVAYYLDKAIKNSKTIAATKLVLGRMYRFTINGREYWYTATFASEINPEKKHLKLVKLSWPDSDTVNIVLTGAERRHDML
jgi:hypothetical protein